MNSLAARRRSLSIRLRQVRTDRFGDGDEGVEALASALGLLGDTWRNYESGVTMPAEVFLGLWELTRVRPHWLITGEGDRYSRTDPKRKFLALN